MPFRFGKGGGRGRRAGRGARGHFHRGMGRKFGAGLPENCICPSCGTILPHNPGLPCFQINCPQCNTLMTRQFITPNLTRQTGRNSGKVIPKIDITLCTGCGKCASVCAVNAITIVNKKAIINEYRCNACQACVSVCSVSAIK